MNGRGGATMAKKKAEPAGDEGGGSKQIGLRLPMPQVEEIEWIAAALGLDNSSLLRMLISENIYIYRERAAQAIERNRARPQ